MTLKHLKLAVLVLVTVFWTPGLSAPISEECSSMDYVIDRHLNDFAEALQSVLDEKNAFEMLRGEDEDNFMFVQGCETIEKDIRQISCKKLRQKNRNLTRNCYKLDIVGTPLSYCLQRKIDVKSVRNQCVKTYLASQDKTELRNLFDNHAKCLVDGFKAVCGEEAAKVAVDNWSKLRFLKEVY